MAMSIWSLQKTASSYLLRIIRNNFEVDEGEDIIKLWYEVRPPRHSSYHDWTKQYRDNVISCRNVFAWLPSIYRWRQGGNGKQFLQEKKIKNFKEFIRKPYALPWVCHLESPWWTWDRKKDAVKPPKEYSSSINYWNTYFTHWNNVEVNGRKFFVVTDNFYKDFEGSMENLRERTGWGRKNNKYENFKKPVNVSVRQPGEFKRHGYYNNKEYLKMYDQEDIDYILENIDRNLYKEVFKYDIERDIQ